MTIDASSRELIYLQVLTELKDINANADSLDELIEQSVELIKSKLDFVFVGVAFLDAARTSIRRYIGTENLFVKRTMFISINDTNHPIAFTLRTGRARFIHVAEVPYQNPHFPDEKVEFYLPLKVDRGNFGIMEIFSPRDSDWEDVAQYYLLLENLVSQVALGCIKWVETEDIGFWVVPSQ